MKTAVVYRSFLGTTKKYAEWLHGEVESDIFRPGQLIETRLAEYDLVILCSGTYGGWITISGCLKKWWNTLQGKNVVLLVTGMVPAEHADSAKSYEKIPEHIRKEIKYFKVPGKIGAAGKEQVKKENLQPVVEYIRSLAGGPDA
jgi:flavodoxin